MDVTTMGAWTATSVPASRPPGGTPSPASAVSVAWFDHTPAAPPTAAMSIVTTAPGATVPRAHEASAPPTVQVPCDVVAPVSVRPAGIWSLTTTPVAAASP